MLPRVSVLMSVYNGTQEVGHSVESILNQDFKDFEFIIVDDASTDNTVKALSNFDDFRIRLICNKKNCGLTKNLNVAARMATGEFIARQDADDVSFPTRLSKQIQFLDEHPEVSLVGTSVRVVDGSNRRITQWEFPTEDAEIKDRLRTNNSFCHGSVMMRKLALQNVGYYREEFRFTQDFDLWLRLAERYSLANLPDVLYARGEHGSAISRRRVSEQLDYHILALAFAQERKSQGKDRVELLNKCTPKNILKYYYGEHRKQAAKWKRDVLWRKIDRAFADNDRFEAYKLWWLAATTYPRALGLRRLVKATYNSILR